MTVTYTLHELAYEEYINAYTWYEDEQTGLGEKFADAVDEIVVKICATPEYYSYAHGSYRQVAVNGFPFTITYKYFPRRKLVFISSIHHHSRNPKTKFRKEK